MMTKEQVEQEFCGELYALLRKWAATLEADDHFRGYSECGEDIRMTVTIPALYADEQRTTEREYTEIDLGKYVIPNKYVMPNATNQTRSEAE